MEKEIKIAITISCAALAVAVPVIFIFIKRRRKRNALKKAILNDGNPNYAETAKNIALSISKSRDLYKNLIAKVHPDRFLDERKVQATDISARITKSKRDYNELCKLQIEVEEFLLVK